MFAGAHLAAEPPRMGKTRVNCRNAESKAVCGIAESPMGNAVPLRTPRKAFGEVPLAGAGRTEPAPEGRILQRTDPHEGAPAQAPPRKEGTTAPWAS